MYICVVIKTKRMRRYLNKNFLLFMVNSNKMFKVFFLVGGWANMVCKSVVGKFNEEDANKQIIELNKMGYPAQKIEDKGNPIGGYFVSAFECETDDEKKKYYDLARAIGFSPIN